MKKERSILKILYEDNHLIAINKPAGYLVQGDITGDKPLSEMVKWYIKEQYSKPGNVFLGVIHRLDRPASGVLIFARTSKALKRMNELFRERQVEKNYWIITNQRPKPISGELSHYLLKDKSKNFVKVYDEKGRRTKDAKKAELSYNLIGEIGTNFLIEVKIKTGRPHQIRAQMSKIGCPIVGDIKYGHKTPEEDGSIYLHSRSLSFIHPVKKEPVEIIADIPDKQLWKLF